LYKVKVVYRAEANMLATDISFFFIVYNKRGRKIWDL